MSGSQLPVPTMEESCILIEKLCRWNVASIIKVVHQSLTSNGFLNMHHFETSNPNACSIQMCGWDKKLNSSLEESCLSKTDEVHALSTTTKYKSGREVLQRTDKDVKQQMIS